jgi:outer membrane protein assembly factor BamD (BamD/ComL family)
MSQNTIGRKDVYMKQLLVHEWYTTIRNKYNNATAKEAMRNLRKYDSSVMLETYYDEDVLETMKTYIVESGRV